MPRVGGLAVFERLRRDAPGTSVVLMTGFANVADAKTALRGGAVEYLSKPFRAAELMEVVGRIEVASALSRARTAGTEEGEIIGRSPPMLRLLDQLDALADSAAPVLITGESGTGKEVTASLIHQRSRPQSPAVCRRQLRARSRRR